MDRRASERSERASELDCSPAHSLPRAAVFPRDIYAPCTRPRRRPGPAFPPPGSPGCRRPPWLPPPPPPRASMGGGCRREGSSGCRSPLFSIGSRGVRISGWVNYWSWSNRSYSAATQLCGRCASAERRRAAARPPLTAHRSLRPSQEIGRGPLPEIDRSNDPGVDSTDAACRSGQGTCSRNSGSIERDPFGLRSHDDKPGLSVWRERRELSRRRRRRNRRLNS